MKGTIRKAVGTVGLSLCFALSALPGHAATVTTLPLPNGTERPDSADVHLFTGQVYVANFGGPNGVYEIDGSTNSVVGFLALPGSNRSVAINPVLDLGYVASSTGVYSFNALPAGMTSIGIASTGSFASGVAVDFTTGLVFAALPLLNEVRIFTSALVPIASVPVGTFPHHIAVNPKTHCAYVGNYSSNDVTVLCPSPIRPLYAPTATIPVGAAPRDIAVNISLNRVYTANEGSGDVTEIDGATNTVSATYALTPTVNPFVNPVSIGADWNTGTIYVGTRDDEVRMLDQFGIEMTGAGSPLPTGRTPYGIGVDHNNAKAYVTNFDSADLSVIS